MEADYKHRGSRAGKQITNMDETGQGIRLQTRCKQAGEADYKQNGNKAGNRLHAWLKNEKEADYQPGGNLTGKQIANTVETGQENRLQTVETCR